MHVAKKTENKLISNISEIEESPSYNDNWESDELMEDCPIIQLLTNMAHIHEDIIFYQKGYQKVSKICDTLQGELIKAMKINQFSNEITYVCIKKTNKVLLGNQIAVQGDTNFCVSENILKEAFLLKHVTVDNAPIGDYIINFIDCFESDTDYYLVTEYISSEMNLKQFISKCNTYIKNGKLSLRHYHRVIRYLLFQLFVTIEWLHSSIHCCHLDLICDNIMISDAEFTEDINGQITINKNPSIKLCDFGVAEIFLNNDFKCNKQGLNIDSEGWFAPNVFNGDTYDAACADNWCLGIILYECMSVGKKLYQPIEIYNKNSAYKTICKGKLKAYLMSENMIKYFGKDCFSLLNSLLIVNEKQRIKGNDILKHKWFKGYYARYKEQIAKKFSDKRQSMFDIDGYRQRFPFYNSDCVS
eukprot:353916_1